MDRPFLRRTFGYPCRWRTDVSADDGTFSIWLDEELESLEERFRAYWTRRSLVVVLIAVCEP